MRQLRLKPDYQDSWHHVYNRIAGLPNEFPFGKVEKAMFIRILMRLSRLYTIRILAFQVMSNHFHLLIQTPKDIPSPEETCKRYAEFHHHLRVLYPNSPRCAQWQERLRDISWFMRHLQHLFTIWYNRTRPAQRRVSIWAGRFKNTLLEDGIAVWRCWKYIELNPLRAGKVKDPADYRFCSLGQWVQKGAHPFPETLTACVLPASKVCCSPNHRRPPTSSRQKWLVIAEEAGLDTAQIKRPSAGGRPHPFPFKSAAVRIGSTDGHWFGNVCSGGNGQLREKGLMINGTQAGP
jgi:REP element-mobilizing transposase RayT